MLWKTFKSGGFFGGGGCTGVWTPVSLGQPECKVGAKNRVYPASNQLMLWQYFSLEPSINILNFAIFKVHHEYSMMNTNNEIKHQLNTEI